MSKSIVVDRVKVIAEMARQNLTCEELAQKAGVGRSSGRDRGVFNRGAFREKKSRKAIQGVCLQHG